MQTKRKSEDGEPNQTEKVTKKLKKSPEPEEVKGKSETNTSGAVLDAPSDDNGPIKKKNLKSSSPIRTSARISQKLKHMDAPQVAPAKDNAITTDSNDPGKVVSKHSNFLTNRAIVYARLPSGEVVGNIVKHSNSNTGTTKPLDKPPNVSNTLKDSKSLKSKSPPSSVPRVQSAYGSCVNSCPVDEFNVDEVLHTSLRATHSMRMFLTSIRDDLKRLVATTGPSTIITIEQIKKRKDLADKLFRAYTGYKQAINSELLVIDKKNVQHPILSTRLSNSKHLDKNDVIELSEESDAE